MPDEKSILKRELQYDLLVVGGGIVGVCLSLEAVRRGLRVALLEKGALGGATSDNSLRILHGGLRHLRRLDVRACRRYMVEQRAWLREAPAYFRPMRFVLSSRRGFALRNLPYAAGCLLYNLLAWDRNRGVPGAARLPLAGVDAHWRPYWYDAQILDPRNLVNHLAEAAQRLGLDIFTDTEVEKLRVQNGKVVGVQCLGRSAQQPLEFHGRVTATALGPWTNQLLAASSLAPVDVHWMQGINVSLGLRLSEHGQVLSRAGQRNYFAVPIEEGLMFGTGQYPLKGLPEAWSPEHLDPEVFLSDLEALLPEMKEGRKKVVKVYRGLIPATRAGGVEPLQSDILLNQAQTGLLCLVAAKYSSARWLAERAVATLN